MTVQQSVVKRGFLTVALALLANACTTTATPSPSPSQSVATPTPTASATPTGTARLKFPCGTVTAYTAPTTSTAGSTTLGTSTFVLAPGSGSTNAAPVTVGASLCLNGNRDAAGAFTQFSVSPMGEGICGIVAAYTPASGTAPASLDFATRPPMTLPVAPGVSFSSAQVSGDQCFRVTPDAQGTAQVVGYIGPR